MRKGKDNQENKNYEKGMNEKQNINKQIMKTYQKENINKKKYSICT